MDISTNQEDRSSNHVERSEARKDLRDTLAEVSVRIERAESDLRPDHLIEDHAFGASLAAGALGFFLGSKLDSWLTGPVIIGALLSFALVRRSSSGSAKYVGTKLSILSH
ncbi:MAG: AtpZ/AtpI family protein [Candidatus Binataceae bacterium]